MVWIERQKVECEDCDGIGTIDDVIMCETCHGTGKESMLTGEYDISTHEVDAEQAHERIKRFIINYQNYKYVKE